MMKKKTVVIISIIVLIAFAASIVLPLILSIARASEINDLFNEIIVNSSEQDNQALDSLQKYIDSLNSEDMNQDVLDSLQNYIDQSAETDGTDLSDSALDDFVEFINEKNNATPTPTATAAPQTREEKIEQRKKEIENIQYEKGSIQKKIDEVDLRVNELNLEIDVLNQEIADCELEVGKLEQLVIAIDADIETVQAQLEEANENAKVQYEAFKERLRAMHENGIMTYLDILFAAGSLADLMERYEIITELAEYDRHMLNKLEAIATTIEESKQRLEQYREDKEKAIMRQRARIMVAESKIEKRDGNIVKLHDVESQLANLYEETEAEEQKIQNEIRVLTSQIEEEKRIKAEQERRARQQQYSGSSTSSSISTIKEYKSDKYLWPIPGYYQITSSFGMRFHPVLKRNSQHTGIDVTAGYGVSVVAAADGKVIKATYSGAYGNYIVIQHEDTATLYAHSSKLLVSEGDEVTAGQTIMQVGSTGYSTGPHLHFEILVNGDAVNPLIYFN